MVRSAIKSVSSCPTSRAVLRELFQISAPKTMERISAGINARPVIFFRRDIQFET